MISLLIITLIALGSALKPTTENSEAEPKKILGKYIQNVRDIESKYVINEALSRSISRYLNGKVNVFPLYRISLKIDRNPIKIPWTLKEARDTSRNVNGSGSKYKYVAVKRKPNNKNIANLY